ncbi:MAG: hypothetical protein M3032_07710 [Verrucomicrobiota bacterium]|nr:hypothetical protein [Verrucomicrobiota bacterium]
MKRLELVLLFVAAIQPAHAMVQGQRSLADIPTAQETLLREVSPKFHKTLMISPVKGWVAVRAQLSGTRLSNPRIVHSELGGQYDSLAIDLANNLQVLGHSNFGSNTTRNMLVHLLIYEIADGRLAISFANLEDAEGSQSRYYGSAWMSVEKANHLWVTINPLTLARNEARGPRTYTVGVEAPTPPRSPLPRATGNKELSGTPYNLPR